MSTTPPNPPSTATRAAKLAEQIAGPLHLAMADHSVSPPVQASVRQEQVTRWRTERVTELNALLQSFAAEERKEAEEQSRLAWERHAEKDRAYGEALAQRDANRNALCRVYELINASDDFDAAEVNEIIKGATGKFPISKEWSVSAAMKEELDRLTAQVRELEGHKAGLIQDVNNLERAVARLAEENERLTEVRNEFADRIYKEGGLLVQLEALRAEKARLVDALREAVPFIGYEASVYDIVQKCRALLAAHTAGRVATRIVAAANRVGPMIFTGAHHHLILWQCGCCGVLSGGEESGFLGDDGKFYNRVEARLIAEAAGQIVHPLPHKPAELFSEELWSYAAWAASKGLKKKSALVMCPAADEEDAAPTSPAPQEAEPVEWMRVSKIDRTGWTDEQLYWLQRQFECDYMRGPWEIEESWNERGYGDFIRVIHRTPLSTMTIAEWSMRGALKWSPAYYVARAHAETLLFAAKHCPSGTVGAEDAAMLDHLDNMGVWDAPTDSKTWTCQLRGTPGTDSNLRIGIRDLLRALVENKQSLARAARREDAK